MRLRGNRALTHHRTPSVLLATLSLVSLGARLAWIDKPYDNATHENGLIFDEKYYVNAARVILRLRVPGAGAYGDAALGHDPNAEHPPLGKLLIAGGMKLFGDNPVGWRIAPLIFGSLALLALYWLVRCAGGGRWLALGAAALLATDNLLMVHGRIATLDIFALTFMLFGVALYLRGNWLPAGLVLGIAACTKLVSTDAFLVLALLEVLRLLVHRSGDGEPTRSHLAIERALLFGKVLAAAAAGYVVLLFALDLAVSPIGGPGDCMVQAGGFRNPLVHTRFMLCYAGKLTSPNGPEGIASWPWQWFLNQEPINYFTVNTNVFANGKQVATHPVIAFQGLMNPAIIFLALPALGLAIHTARRDRDLVSMLVLAWFLGTFIPFLIIGAPLGNLGHRTSYLYYMVLVLPAVYIGVARLLSRRFVPPAVLVGFIVIAGYWFVTLYPIRSFTP